MDRYLKKLILVIIDVILIIFAFIFSTLLAEHGFIVLSFLGFAKILFWIVIIKISTYVIFNLYSSMWRYASIQEITEVFSATLTASALSLLFFYPYFNFLWIKIIIIDWLLNLHLIGGIRFGYRIIINYNKKNSYRNVKKVIVYGAGKIGASIVKELLEHPEYEPVIIIDDDINKNKTRIHGIPVIHSAALSKELLFKKDVKEIIIAIPSLNKFKLRQIFNLYKSLGCKVKTLPGVNDLISGKVSIKQIRNVNLEDLLGREPVDLNIEKISEYIENQVVLVTGGAGSIGSELCRQLLKFNPQKLIVLDINENDSFMLQQELLYKFSMHKLSFLIGSITDKLWIEKVFNTYKPGVVFHAAAHKHVPLMEDNPYEAVKNNILGTLNLARSACQYGVKKFVLISTDKAVNPTSIMGVTKRISEIIVQAMNQSLKTKFSIVRFGNVLGSKGSVIPLFEKQLEWSNTIKITHPDAKRYFMTITEAVQLVIQAGAMADGGEVFVLDMGNPINILELAKDLLYLLDLEEDANIEFSGLRPGEKISEELFLNNCTLSSTFHKKIYKEITSVDINIGELAKCLEKLELACLEERENFFEILKEIVPEFNKGRAIINSINT